MLLILWLDIIWARPGHSVSKLLGSDLGSG